MTNLTLAIDENVLRRARVRAVNEGTSVNAVARKAITDYADADGRTEWQAALDKIVDLADSGDYGGGYSGRTWKREDLYDRTVR